jgi:hypothetical protein
MILQTYGPHGWHEKIHLLSYRSNWLANNLNNMNIPFFRADNSNIITIKADFVGEEIAAKHGLVPDSHDGNPQWYKVVVMDHVTIDAMEPLILDLKERQAQH